MWIETTLDLGDMGQRQVQVRYQARSGRYPEIKEVILDSVDLHRWLTESAIESLVDICLADIDLANEVGLHALWDQQRDERRQAA